jgi:predicted lipid-binding transport protein (Tim44 family)
MAFGLYRAIIDAGAWDWLAGIVALVGVVAMIATESYTYQIAARAFAEGERRAFVVAGLGALACSAMVVYAVWNGQNTRALITAVVISIILYVSMANKTYLDTRKDGRLEVVTVQASQTAAQVDLLKAQAEIERQKASAEKAKARAAKVSSVQPSNTPNTANKPANATKHAGQFKSDPAMVAKIEQFWRDNPSATLRDAAKACGCAPSTAGNYKP